jgi:hypothetical protein
MTDHNKEYMQSMTQAEMEADFFGEDDRPEAEVFPLPKSEGEGIPVQAVSVETEIPPLTMHLCDVCKDAEMHGVFSSSCGPISFAYCYECASKGAEPYGALIAYISSAYSVQEWDSPATQVHYSNSRLVQASLEVAGKTFAEWVSDVRNSIIKFDREYNDHLRKVELGDAVIDNPERVFTFGEIATVFSKPDDNRLVEIVAAKYDNTMELMVDYTGSYHLLHRRGNDTFTYAKRVEFVPEGDPRLNK